MIHCGAMRAAEQALLYVVPSERGMLVMVSLVANGYIPSGTGVPLAMALAVPDVVSAVASPKMTLITAMRAAVLTEGRGIAAQYHWG
jgi:hypothetical protein